MILLNKVFKHHKLVCHRAEIYLKNTCICGGDPGDTNFRVSLHKHILPTALYISFTILLRLKNVHKHLVCPTFALVTTCTLTGMDFTICVKPVDPCYRSMA